MVLERGLEPLYTAIIYTGLSARPKNLDRHLYRHLRAAIKF